ncbi:FecR domain-containing protein [Pedobacter sp. JY14-1]|uniref:FecR family protein n=1 Tax=Pedobacter sp. JY14-1 TaxID=3034151 RepID=UPI0023E2ADD5|nr:FecR domain-containing protein [Pedobacter sp. JY14-1]
MNGQQDKNERAQKYKLHFFRQRDLPELSASELEAETGQIYRQLMQGRHSRKSVSYRLWYPAAAAALLLVAGVFFWQRQPKMAGTQTAVLKNANYDTDIQPGKSAAVLTLASGKKIDLGLSRNGRIADEPGALVSKTADGTVIYSASTKWSGSGTVNTLSTVRGQQYRVVLPDGSKVWLNSASSITYPTSFSGMQNRAVKLIGEAYFEVAKDRSRPFIVKTSKQEVEVLGTHFNVNSYNDENAVRTTLLEGSVKVTNEKGQSILKPGHQAAVSGGAPVISKVNASESVAWKNGDFIFDNERFDSILRQLSRWYNVDIKGAGMDKDIRFSGTISRSKPISTVLRALELTGQVRFQLEGHTLTVE